MESESKRIDREQLKLQMQSWRYAKDTESTTLRSS